LSRAVEALVKDLYPKRMTHMPPSRALAVSAKTRC
jgi:hypothetical protein